MAGVALGGVGAAGKAAGMMVRAAGRGVSNYTTPGKGVDIGKKLANDLFGSK